MKQVTLEELLEAGSHFGHQVTRGNPKAREFIFEARDGIHIIDLAKTKAGLDEAAEYIRSIAAKGGSIIVVGTKRQAQEIVKEEAKRAKEAGADGLFYVTNRWIGGTLTNFSEVLKNYKKLKDTTAMLKDADERSKYTKRELSLFEKERQKLEGFYGGIADMVQKPDALFIIDTHAEYNAVAEAHAENVTTVGIVDTNADPLVIDYPIPANDDAVGSVKLILNHIVDAWIEGRKQKSQASNPNSQEQKKESSAEKNSKTQKAEPQTKVAPEAQSAEKKASGKEEAVKESHIVAKESTAKTVATQTKKKASPTKKITGSSSST